MLQYWLFRLFSLLVPLIPPAVAYRLCDWLGAVLCRLLRRQHRNVRGNLSVVLGGHADQSRVNALVCKVFREGAKYYYDTFRVPTLSDSALERLVTVEGWEKLDRCLAKGRGVVVFTGHIGSPALVAQILAVRGYCVTSVVEPVEPESLFELMTRVRGSRGIRFVPLGPSSARELMDALRRNEIVGIVADRDVGGTGVSVDFFGIETRLPAGPALLALRAGADLLPAFTYRVGEGRFVGQIWDPIEVRRTGKLREDVRLNTQEMGRALEKAIRRSPEQWVVFEPIWPEGISPSGPGVAN